MRIRLQSQRICGIRLSALVEILIALAVFCALDGFLGHADRFFTVEPHPFWIVVLLITVQYGTVEGIAAAAAASLALLAGNLPDYLPHEDLFAYWGRMLFNPLLWFSASVILGEMTLRHRRGKQDACNQLLRAKQEAAFLGEAYRELEREKLRFEKQLATFVRSPAQLLKALSEIDLSNPEKVLLGARLLVRVLLDPPKHSLYLVDDSVLAHLSAEGWTNEREFTTRFRKDHPIFAALVSQRRSLCIANPEDADILGREGVLAAPIVDPLSSGGRVVGMLKIEKIDFFDLHVSTRAAFELIAEWIGHAYACALQLTMLKHRVERTVERSVSARTVPFAESDDASDTQDDDTDV